MHLLEFLRPPHNHSGFTLIELLVVIAIIAILSVVVILTLNPAGLLQSSRDSNRLSDLQTMNTALGLYATDQSSGSLGSSSIVYISVPDPSATSSAGDQCQGLGLPTAPSGTTYFCPSSSTARSVNGTGWIPVNFSSISEGSPLGALPQDPTNTTSTGNYYTYSTNGSQYIVTAIPESQKTKSNLASNPQIPDYPEVMAQGSNLTISPLWSTTGLVGYWSFEEGSGTTALDTSGNNNTGSWNGSLISGSHYAGGKVGAYAGNFDGSTDYIATNSASLRFNGLTTMSLLSWIKYTGSDAYIIANGYACVDYPQYVIQILSGKVNGTFSNTNSLSGAKTLSGSTTLVSGNWYLVGAVLNGTSITVFLNGSIDGTNNAFTGSLWNTADNTYIGAVRSNCGNPAAAYFPGLIDDVRVYNRALSASEIQALYNAQK